MQTNSLDPDQARQNVGPDLDPNCLTLMVFLKEFIEKDDFENYPGCKSLLELNPSTVSKVSLH